MTSHSTSDSLLICRMDSLSRALRAALKIAGKKELSFVRLSRPAEEKLAVSAVNEKATFATTLHANFIHWEEDRDHVIDISKPVAASLAGFEIKMPKGLDSDPLVSLRIGEEALRLRDETGLFPIARGRNEYREAEPVLPGNHREALSRTSTWPGGSFLFPPEELATVASVAKALDKPVGLMQRLVRDNAVRWYVVGPGWQLSMAATPESRKMADNETAQDQEPEHDQDAEQSDAEQSDADGEPANPVTKIVRVAAPEFAPA